MLSDLRFTFEATSAYGALVGRLNLQRLTLVTHLVLPQNPERRKVLRTCAAAASEGALVRFLVRIQVGDVHESSRTQIARVRVKIVEQFLVNQKALGVVEDFQTFRTLFIPIGGIKFRYLVLVSR